MPLKYIHFYFKVSLNFLIFILRHILHLFIITNRIVKFRVAYSGISLTNFNIFVKFLDMPLFISDWHHLNCHSYDLHTKRTLWRCYTLYTKTAFPFKSIENDAKSWKHRSTRNHICISAFACIGFLQLLYVLFLYIESRTYVNCIRENTLCFYTCHCSTHERTNVIVNKSRKSCIVNYLR